MASEPKTKPTDIPVEDYIAAVDNLGRREDALVVDALIREVTGETPVMWGPSIIGYGSYQTPTGPWPLAGFSPRKANLVVYLATEFDTRDDLLAKLGKHSTGKSCLYLNRLSTIDMSVLRQLIADSVAHTRRHSPRC